jgi:serine/threonine protein kinase
MARIRSHYLVECLDVWLKENYYLINGFGNYKNSGITPNHEVFNSNKTLLLHIQMELCYKTLKDIIIQMNEELNHRPLGYHISSEIFIELLECVNYLHKQNIIHRDLKPSNILITFGNYGRLVKLGDFGLATVHDFEGQSHSKYMGT